MTSCGVTLAPVSRTVNVFWNRRPKPPFAGFKRRPRTLPLIAPARSSASRVFTGFAQLPSSRAIALGLRRRERGGLGVVNPDRLVEPGELEDLLVVVVQAAREELLLLAVRADQERHEQPD